MYRPKTQLLYWRKISWIGHVNTDRNRTINQELFPKQKHPNILFFHLSFSNRYVDNHTKHVFTLPLKTQSVIVVAYLQMEFTVDRLVVGVDHFECVTSVSIHESESIRSSTVSHQEGHLVHWLRSECDKIPECIWILRKERWLKMLVNSHQYKCNREC